MLTGVKTLAALLSLLFALESCRTQPDNPPPEPAAIPRGAVEALMAAQQRAWNKGDWEGFIAGYWNDAHLTFSGSRGITRGRADILEQYQKGYPDAAARGRLTFHLLEFRPVGRDAALVLGRYELEKAKPDSGYFSLLVERTPQGVKITHDHTSKSPAKKQ